MPAWRRLLCVLIGLPVACAGVYLISDGNTRLLIPAAFLIGVGGLLAASGISPRATRNY